MIWLADFNTKMQRAALKIQEQFGDDASEKVYLKINDKEKTIRPRSKDDPFGRGFRKYKDTLREIVKKDE